MPQPCQRAAGQQCRRLAPSVSSNTAAAAAAAAAPETATEKREKKNTATRRRKDERKDGNPEISNRQTRQTTKQTGTSRHSPKSQPRLTPASGDLQGEAQPQTQTGRDQSCAERGWRGRGQVCKASQRVSPVTTIAIMLLNMGVCRDRAPVAVGADGPSGVVSSSPSVSNTAAYTAQRARCRGGVRVRGVLGGDLRGPPCAWKVGSFRDPCLEWQGQSHVRRGGWG